MILKPDENVVKLLLQIGSHMSELPEKEVLKLNSLTSMNHGVDVRRPTARSVRILSQAVGIHLAMELVEALSKQGVAKEQLIAIPTES